jgi:uncharacterized protein involved in exopolysaccharide biosynthesis
MAEQHQHPQERHYYEEHYDEIDLADVALAIWRRRWLFVGTFAAVFGLAVAYAFLVTPVYEHRATLEIGQVPSGRNLNPIESASSLKDRLERLYVPDVIYQYRQEDPENRPPVEIKITVPEESGLGKLAAEGPDDKTERNLRLLQQVIDRAKDNHDRIFDLVVSEHEADLISARNALEALQSQEKVLKGDLERIKRRAELIEENIESLESSIQEANAQRAAVAESASNEEKAMTMLLIDSQIQQERRRLEDLRERLEVDLEQQRDRLENSIGDNQRSQENQQQEIATLVARQSAMQRTRAVIPPSRSFEPVAPNKRLILALGFVLAGMLGVLVVGINGLLARARRKMEQEDAASAQ